jgi:hypothetical protein
MNVAMHIRNKTASITPPSIDSWPYDAAQGVNLFASRSVVDNRRINALHLGG